MGIQNDIYPREIWGYLTEGWGEEFIQLTTIYLALYRTTL